MSQNPYLSVVIPCFNEASNIKNGVLEEIYNFLSKKDYSYEVLFVDDGSTDNSRELISAFMKNKNKYSLITNPHQGKAKTVITGILKSKGEYILFTDFDQATPIYELDNTLPLFKKYDIIIGSRKDKRKGSPFFRVIMARGFMIARNLLLNLDITDTQCGFKVFKREAAHTVFKKLRLYKSRRLLSGSSVTAGFDVELLFIARKMGYRILEVPVKWRYVETRRVNLIWDSIEGLKDLIRIKTNDLRGVYD